MLYYMPIEPMEMRYTAQWLRWYPEEFERQGVEYRTILPGREYYADEPGKEAFFDWRQTFIFKLEQMKQLLRQDLRDGDWVFFADGEYPGMEAIEYLKRLLGIGVKVAAFWHAGTYDRTDLTATAGIRGRSFEEGWFDVADLIFVGSSYHRDMIFSERAVERDKVKVVGLPVSMGGEDDKEGLEQGSKGYREEKRILFAGRHGYDKGYDIVEMLQSRGFPIVSAKDQDWKDKRVFYREMHRSRVVFCPSRHENFGLNPVDALSMGIPVVAPCGLSFVDYMPREMMYWTEGEMKEMLWHWLEMDMVPDNLPSYVEKYDRRMVIAKMLKEMGY